MPILLAVGCASAPQPATTAPAASASSAPASVPVSAGWEGKWARFHSMRNDAWLTLPDGPSWKIDDHTASWLVAKHPGTQSTLRLAMFRTDKPQNKAKCEATARAHDPSLAREDQAKLVEARDEDVLAGWDGHAFSTVAEKNGAIEGRYLAFVANVRRCIAVDFVTTQSGPRAEAIVGTRLADVAQIVHQLKIEDPRSGPDRIAPP